MSANLTSETSGLRPWAPAWWAHESRYLSLLAPGAVFAGMLAGGAIAPKTSLTLELVCALVLLGALASRHVRADLRQIRGLTWPAAFFALTLIVALWSMTPLVPGGPHPAWGRADAGAAAATIDKGQTLLEIVKLLGLGVIFLLGCVSGASGPRARASFRVILAMGAAFGLWAILAFAAGRLGANIRLTASFGVPNTAATVFAILLMLALGAVVSAARRASQGRSPLAAVVPGAAACVIIAACLVATSSRGGFVAAAAGLAAFAGLQAFLGRTAWTRTTLGVAIGVIAAAALLALVGDNLIDRFGAANWEFSGRRAIFDTHWRAFRDAPWMGYGLGSFDAVNRSLLSSGNLADLWTVRAAHNVYLSWLEQAGVLGAAPMFMTLATVIALTLRGAARRSRFKAPLFALLAADVVVLVHGVTDFALETYSVAALWSLLLGLQFAAAQGARR